MERAMSEAVGDEDIRSFAARYNTEALLADGFEDAFIGMAERCSQPAIAVYDAGHCIRILMERDGMNLNEAVEFLDFNVLGAWLGENTPAFLWKYRGEGRE
jgi:hypothetical protein